MVVMCVDKPVCKSWTLVRKMGIKKILKRLGKQAGNEAPM
jgi:hypothetical protein